MITLILITYTNINTIKYQNMLINLISATLNLSTNKQASKNRHNNKKIGRHRVSTLMLHDVVYKVQCDTLKCHKNKCYNILNALNVI